jgi:flagellar biosynthesis protein FlhG
VIAVTSGKGGVGKTLVATNLAIALAAQEHRVVLFDMDMGLANADIVLGVEPRHNWDDVLSGRRSVDDVLVEGPGGIALVAGTSGVARMANLSEFERHQLKVAMAEIEDRYDVVVLDCGAGISTNVTGFASSADTVLVLATPEPPALTDAYAMVKAFAQTPIESGVPASSLGVIVNLAESRREGRDTYERLAGVAARFLHLPLTDYGYILRDDHVSAAVRDRCPVILKYPRSSASSCLMASASRLSREMGRPEPSQSLFYRVINMFL